MPLGFFLDEFSQEIKGAREREYDRLRREDEREFQLLSVLAQHGTPEIQGLAGTALLEMARGEKGAPKRQKGLRGFMGDMERSSYFPAVDQMLRTTQVAQGPAQAGAGRLPAGSPVEPGGPAMPGSVPQEPRLPAGRQPFGGGMMPAETSGPAFQQPGAPQEPQPILASQPGPGMQPFQRPPEPTIRTLFPTAEEIATSNARAGIMGRGQAMREQILAAGGTEADVRDALMGIAGAPRRRGSQKEMMITFVDPMTGQMTQGLGSFDATTGEYFVNGEQVQGISAQAIPRAPSAGAGPRPQLKVNAAGEYVWMYPPAGAAPGAAAGAGVPPEPTAGTSAQTGVQAPPRSEPLTGESPSGTIDVLEPDGTIGIYERLRGGGRGNKIGTKASPASQATASQEARQAQAWLNTIEKIASSRSKDKRGRPVARTMQMLDEITREVTGNPNATYNDVSSSAKGVMSQKGARSGVTPEGASAIIRELNNLVNPAQPAPMGPPPEPR
jgi:hypothetical protein